MELKLNPKDRIPLYVQLKSQLAHLIETGQLQTGAQLPTVRQLAGFLRINRNTVSKVFTELQRDGYLSCERGKGTFVSIEGIQTKTSINKMQALVRIVDEALEKAKQMGFSPEELSSTLYARTKTAPNSDPLPRPKLLFVECNRPQIGLFRAELNEALSVQVDGILLADLKRTIRRTPESIKRYALVVTTFYHIHEVKALLAKTGVEVMGLLIEAGLETLMRLTSLPEGTKVGVACNEWTGSENLKLSIENAGLKHLHLVLGCGQDEESLKKIIDEVSVIVCSILVEQKIRAIAPPDKEIVVDDRRLDRAGIEMLLSRLDDLSATEGNPSEALDRQDSVSFKKFKSAK
ncbi:MAG: GntR family transcriptional regulator [Desulfobacteraceae bacterium]|nr:MAG: GntR family transcriptional regulator [Desulfobacteraceae bacterium]